MSKVLHLLEIQKLQFSDKPLAERQLLEFLQQTEDPKISQVELKPKPESLNSINGFVTFTNNEKYFFKSHVEENEKVSEYYNASVLANAGYPVVSAKRIKQRPGQQIAFYEILSMTTLFDELKSEEDWQRENPNQTSPKAAHLVQAQIELDKSVSHILHQTLRTISTEDHAKAPIHQLFSNRLAEDGRLGLFYRNKSITLDQRAVSFEELSVMHWTINGADYACTLGDNIELAKALLAPKEGPASIGHGDAHNGNIFVNMDVNTGEPLPSMGTADTDASTKARLVMFDPAFAGEHNPILDVTKTIFHNHFARWMYFPEQVVAEFKLTHSLSDNRITIEHDFRPSKIRTQLLRIKIADVIKPLINKLDEQKLLQDNWRHYLRCALFCCPFLTVNLFASFVPGGTLAERYTLPIKLLALSMAIELGCESRSGSNTLADLIDEIFD